MIQTNVSKTKTGVNVKFTGNVKKESIAAMVEDCSKGTCGCSCDPHTFEKIEKMAVLGDDGEVTISLTGKTLAVEEIKKALGGCDIG